MDTAAVNVRMPVETLGTIDDWRRKQDDLPGRPEAIRRLVELGLSQTREPAPRVLSTAKEAAARAEELAANRDRVSRSRKR